MGLEKYKNIKCNERAKKAIDKVRYKLNQKGDYFYTYSDTILELVKGYKK